MDITSPQKYIFNELLVVKKIFLIYPGFLPDEQQSLSMVAINLSK